MSGFGQWQKYDAVPDVLFIRDIVQETSEIALPVPALSLIHQNMSHRLFPVLSIGACPNVPTQLI